MSFPSLILVSKERGSPLSGYFFAALLLFPALLLPPLLAAKGPAPEQTISLESLGFQTIAPRYLLSGGTMITLDYVDNQHLLVTFGVPRLMLRLGDCPPEDQDRVVDAILLELPSGHELARAEWRLHDIGRYLWPLGNGYFLLRQRNQLTTFAPLAQLPSGEAFALHPFLHFDNPIDAIYVSADRDLLTIETSKRVRKPQSELTTIARMIQGSQGIAGPPATAPPSSLGPSQPTRPIGLLRRDPAQAAAALDPQDPGNPEQPDNPVRIHFIRLLPPATPDGHLIAQHAGSIDTRKHLVIPLSAEGYLRTRDITNTSVALDFSTFSGKVTDLGGFDTTCPPSPTFLSHSEFVAFGCRGSDDRLTLAGFNIHGDLMWQLNFSDAQAYPSFAGANTAGRFAFSRTLTTGAIAGSQTPFSDQLTTQEVRVFQTYNGKQLLRVATSPIQRAGQNFALSPDGLSLAVIQDPIDPHLKEVQHKPAIEIYALPALSDKDRHEVNAEEALAPPHSEAPIVFSVAQVKEAVAVQGGPDSIVTSSQAALLPANARISAAAPAATPLPASAAPDSRPHFTARATSTNAGAPPSAAPVPAAASSNSPTTSPSEQAAAGDQPEQRHKPPTLYDPDYDGPLDASNPTAASSDGLRPPQ
jgi:hypothetical protein